MSRTIGVKVMNRSKVVLAEADCMAVMSAIPKASVSMVLCDLPYGTTQNPWDSVIPLEALWAEYKRILTANGVVVLTGQGPFTARLICSQEALFKYKLTWVKSKATNFLNAKRQPLRKHEDVCVFYQKQPTYQPQMSEGASYDKGVRKDQLTGSYGTFDPVHVRSEGGRYPTDVIYFKTAESEGPVIHPTQKPVALGRYLVSTYTKPGDVVLDNAFGSGSFVIAAAAEGRSVIGIEKNADATAFKREMVDLIAVAKERLSPYAASIESRILYGASAGACREPFNWALEAGMKPAPTLMTRLKQSQAHTDLLTALSA